MILRFLIGYKLIFALGIIFISCDTFAQRKYVGRSIQVEESIKITNLYWSGIRFKEMNLKFKGSDTLHNCKVIFLNASSDKLSAFKCEIIVESGWLVQFQLNVNSAILTEALLLECESFYGKPRKNSSTKTNQMIIWDQIGKNGKRINTVLITGNKNKKAELISWQL